ncbi:Succinyl-CoA--L-malate CoA-transferase alpha subunit [Nocardia cerradoensis]|uniref:Succinyl-CoA--L-malate CoA-transferase alpha subunit n=1 Tax=Nocardia cerradoensis TaxID=85688 RepID=A0A231GUW7_9NOCA|nr:Succinyl-CoA--L-malate CoA-transferase alpha subunit [Nocardia cerradoensis]
MQSDSTLVQDFRVLDLTSGIAGPYATKLLVDAGADVVKVEPPGGDEYRRWTASDADLGGTDGAMFRYLNAGKRSVVATPGIADLRALLAGADLLIESDADDELLSAIRSEFPALDVVSISPFGRSGPWRGRSWTEFTLQAQAGGLGGRVYPGRAPVHAGGRLGEWITGSFAGAAALVLRTASRRRKQRGNHLDLSMLECICLAMSMYGSLSRSLAGGRPAPLTTEIPSIERSADGWVGFCTITGQQFQDFLLMIDRADLLDDPTIVDMKQRQTRYEEFQKIIEEWTTTMPTSVIEEIASAMRIPVAPVGRPDTVAENDHFAARGVFVENPAGFRQPRRPYLVDGVAAAAPKPAPELGADTGRIEWEPRIREVATPDGLPLDGLRVIDLTGFWAGPMATQILAAFGADVIKIESTQRPDGMRFTSSKPPTFDGWWEWGAYFQGANAGKRGITLDLTRPQGRDALLALVAEADVLIENFSPRVLDNFGLDWEMLSAANPRLTMVRMPAFGLDGPWRDRTGFAQTMEQATGLSWMTGYPDAAPMVLKGPCDPIAGLHALVAALAALERADSRDRGAFVEVPMVESALNVAAEVVIEYGAYGAELMRAGNRGPVAAPQNVYRCGDGDQEQWLAIAVQTDEQWSAMRTVLGNPDWARAPELADGRGRRRAHDEIDAHLAAFCAGRDADELAETLAAQGVPAAPVVLPADSIENPQFAARSFAELLDHPLVGTHRVPGMPFRLEARTRPWLTRPAPTLGQHNNEVLREIAGLDPDRIAELRASGVIGERPDNL